MFDNKMKITILKRTINQDIIDEYCSEEIGACSVFTDGQVFFTEGLKQPEGFCDWAWNDIHKSYLTVAMGGCFFFMKRKNNIIACCSDGMRPVVFNIEKIEE